MLVITMAIEVLRREVFAFSSIWGEEIVRYSFIYLVWIGAAAAVKERAHIRIDVIMHYLSPRIKALLYIFGDLGHVLCCDRRPLLFTGDGAYLGQVRLGHRRPANLQSVVLDGCAPSAFC